MITVNSKSVEFIEGETISELLKRMNYIFPLLVVKINGNVIKKEKFGETTYADGDDIKIIHLISGG